MAWNSRREKPSRGKVTSGQRAFSYVKACGIIGKSFVGNRLAAVGNVSRLSELDRLVFPDTSRDLPEKELLKDIEKRIINRATDAIQTVAKSFRQAPDFIVLLIRGWEYENLKNALTAIAAGDNQKPSFIDLKKFGVVDYSAWPDLNAMLKNTEFEYLLKMQDQSPIKLQAELDRRYYTALWQALGCLKASDRLISEKITAEEITLRNLVCALRLRTYYHMDRKEIIPHLTDIKIKRSGSYYSLAHEALASLDFPLDNREPWTALKHAEFLNPPDASGGWKADPRFFQNAAAKYLYRMASHNFHFRAFSLDSVFCFIKIKQFEEDVLTSCAECLGMGMTSADAFAMLGVETK